MDIGNSRIKFALWNDAAWQQYTSHFIDIKNLNAWLDAALQDVHVQSVYVSCVVDDAHDVIIAWFKSRWDITPIFCKSSHSLAGVMNAYKNPDALGVDRWLAMIAAFNMHRSPVCIISCGTAVTLDVVSHLGEHQGGLIMPGLRVMQESLISSTSKIHVNNGEITKLAKNTGDAVVSGCVQLLALGLDGLIRQYIDAYPGLQVVITGGDAKRIAMHMQIKTEFQEKLVLDGIRIVSELDC